MNNIKSTAHDAYDRGCRSISIRIVAFAPARVSSRHAVRAGAA
jgi:hypothetical protein